MAFSANVVLRVLPFGDPTKVDFPRAALVRLTLDHLQYLQERISREEVIMRRGSYPSARSRYRLRRRCRRGTGIRASPGGRTCLRPGAVARRRIIGSDGPGTAFCRGA